MELKTSSELIFVYNANSGFFAGIKDLIHKSVSPKTYVCNLCGLTFNGASMKQEWREFINSLPLKTTFLHKDEFIKQYPKYTTAQFPAVYKIEDATLTEIIPAFEVNKAKSLSDLKSLILETLK